MILNGVARHADTVLPIVRANLDALFEDPPPDLAARLDGLPKLLILAVVFRRS